MIPCICINDKDRPKEIPASQWVKQGGEYHITFIAYCLPQKLLAFSLYERPLVGTDPYEYFNAERFGIHEKDLEAFKQMCKDTRELDDFDVMEAIENSSLELIND